MFQLDVAVPSPIYSNFSYLAEQDVEPGCRVLVPFGTRKVIGVVLPRRAESQSNPKKDFALKPIDKVIDAKPIFDSTMLQLASWLSQYYGHPLGEVFKTMLPASVKKKSKLGFRLTDDGAERAAQETDEVGQVLAVLFAKKSVQTPKGLESGLKRIAKKLSLENPPDVRSLEKNRLIAYAKKTDVAARALVQNERYEEFHIADVENKALQLKGIQRDAFEMILSKGVRALPKERKAFLLRGVTGSGKTEVYLQAIAASIKEESSLQGILPQSLVLVPEISLTPQMTRIFRERFLGRVSVVHSAMSDEERWEQLHRIRTGASLVLIGPRSAVFGPFANLKLIIVDEEHDPSYKQHSGLLYNGRDVAVLRAKLEGAVCLLGSATPSLESYENALSGKYHLLELPTRISGLPLPAVRLVEAKAGYSFGQVVNAQLIKQLDAGSFSVPVDDAIVEELQKNLELKQQSIVLVNRRGFAFYLFSLKNKKAISCPHCSISLTLHKRSTQLRCHYCDYRITTRDVIEDAPDDTFVAVGYGSEKLEAALQERLPQAKIVRLDSDTVARKDVLPKTLQQFRNGEIDILVGTQILAKGHDFPNVTLMVILDVDQLLDLPDFRSGERTFQLIVQAAGRAGRAELPGRVLIQCSRPNDVVIQDALRQDFTGFAMRELEYRKALKYPPFAKMVHVEISGGDYAKLEAFCQRMVKWLERLALEHPDLPKQVRVMGPSVPAIEMIRNRYRRSLILSSARLDALQHLTRMLQSAFQKLEGDLKLKIDIDPQSLI